MTTCKARREGDQMCCGKCGLQWDVDDPEPPECRSVRLLHVRSRGKSQVGRLWLERMKEVLTDD